MGAKSQGGRIGGGGSTAEGDAAAIDNRGNVGAGCNADALDSLAHIETRSAGESGHSRAGIRQGADLAGLSCEHHRAAAGEHHTTRAASEHAAQGKNSGAEVVNVQLRATGTDLAAINGGIAGATEKQGTGAECQHAGGAGADITAEEDRAAAIGGIDGEGVDRAAAQGAAIGPVQCANTRNVGGVVSAGAVAGAAECGARGVIVALEIAARELADTRAGAISDESVAEDAIGTAGSTAAGGGAGVGKEACSDVHIEDGVRPAGDDRCCRQVQSRKVAEHHRAAGASSKCDIAQIHCSTIVDSEVTTGKIGCGKTAGEGAGVHHEGATIKVQGGGQVGTAKVQSAGIDRGGTCIGAGASEGPGACTVFDDATCAGADDASDDVAARAGPCQSQIKARACDGAGIADIEAAGVRRNGGRRAEGDKPGVSIGTADVIKRTGLTCASTAAIQCQGRADIDTSLKLQRSTRSDRDSGSGAKRAGVLHIHNTTVDEGGTAVGVCNRQREDTVIILGQAADAADAQAADGGVARTCKGQCKAAASDSTRERQRAASDVGVDL